MNTSYTRIKLHTVFLLVLFTAILISGAFSEVPLGKGSLSARLYSKQRLVETESKLNPNNVFCVEDGFYGTEVFTLGYAQNSERVSLRFNDFGSFSAATDPDGINCIGEMYGSIRLGEVFIDLGKKRINQSLSYFKSPINFVLDNYKQYELNFSEGRFMANLDFFTNYGFIGVSYIPKIDFNSSIERYASSSQVQQGLLRYDATIRNFTMGIAVSKDDFWRIGTHFSTVLGDYAEVHLEGIFNEQKTRSQLLLVDGFASIDSKSAHNRYEGLVGITANFPQISGIVEYYYNQAGYSANEWANVTNTYQDLRNAEAGSMIYFYNLKASYQSLSLNRSYNSRHYLMIRLSNPTTDDYQIAMNTIINLQDFSGMVMPSFSYSGWDHITLEAQFAKNFGSPYSEFSLYGEVWSCGLSIEIWL